MQSVLAVVTEPAIWIGHSFGARLVAELTARNSELVERSVLLDPALWLTPDVTYRLAEDELSDLSFASPEEAVEHRVLTGGLMRTPPVATPRQRELVGAPLFDPRLLGIVRAAVRAPGLQ